MSVPIDQTVIQAVAGSRLRGAITLTSSGLGLILDYNEDETYIIDLRMNRMLDVDEAATEIMVATRRLERQAAEIEALNAATPGPEPIAPPDEPNPDDAEGAWDIPAWVSPHPVEEKVEGELDDLVQKRTTEKVEGWEGE